MLNRDFSPLPGIRALISLAACLLASSLLAGCASSPPLPSPAAVAEEAETGSITALTLHEGELYISRSHPGGCRIERHLGEPAGSLPTEMAVPDICPDRMTADSDGALLLETSRGVVIVEGDKRRSYAHLAHVTPLNYVTESAGVLTWNRDGQTATAEGEWTGPAVILDREGAVIAVRRTAEGDRLVRLAWPDDGERLAETILTDPLESIVAIESDDDQKELALTVLRDGSYDIAIANAEEQFMNWIPEDPADELRPRWSPIGYKLSYIIRSRGGDILRTVHVPTAAMVLLDFPDSTINDYEWLPDGERVAVAVSSLLESDHVVEATYTGSSRKTVVEPRHRYARQIERLPGTPAGTALIMPDVVRYDRRQPLVIWTSETSSGGARFNSDLIPLLDRADLGLVVVNGSAADISPEFWNALAEMRWVDGAETWIVGPGAEEDVPTGVQRIEKTGDREISQWIVNHLEEGRVKQ